MTGYKFHQKEVKTETDDQILLKYHKAAAHARQPFCIPPSEDGMTGMIRF